MSEIRNFRGLLLKFCRYFCCASSEIGVGRKGHLMSSMVMKYRYPVDLPFEVLRLMGVKNAAKFLSARVRLIKAQKVST